MQKIWDWMWDVAGVFMRLRSHKTTTLSVLEMKIRRVAIAQCPLLLSLHTTRARVRVYLRRVQ